MSLKARLTALLEEIIPRAEFYAGEHRYFQPSDSLFLCSKDFRNEHKQAKFFVLTGFRMPIPSDYIRPNVVADQFPADHFAQLVGLVKQLLDPYIDADKHSFIAVLPSPRVFDQNLQGSVEHFSKSIVRCAALFGVSETVDAVLRLVEGDTARYTQVVVLDGVSTSPRKEGVNLWPGARLVDWNQAFGDRLGESTLGIPDAVMTQNNHSDINTFSFGRGTTLLCIERTGGPIIRRSEDAEPRPEGSCVPVSPHQLSTEIAVSTLSLIVNHPILEICSWHWYDAKVQALLGYHNELALDQNMGGPQLRLGRLVGANHASLIHNIHEGLSRQGVFEELRVPIQRWRRSKAASNGVDLAVDLRIALESLFLDKGNNMELSFRLALRAAWYLGANRDERTRIFEAVREAYSIGSKAIHTGKGYDDVIPAKLAMAQDICRMSILRRISEGGKPPNWEEVVLGD